MTTPNRARALVLVALSAAAGLVACGTADSGANAAVVATDPQPADGSRRVRVDSAQLKQLQLEELSPNAPAAAIKATGTIEFNADRTAKLLPPVSGQVQDLSVNVGDRVRKNDTLFMLSSREVAAAVADHMASHKDVELAEKTNAMTKDLFEHQAASRMALEQSESELGKARSRLLQTEESLRVIGFDPHGEDWTTPIHPRIAIRAPIDGTVIERTVTEGQFVGSETAPLMTIADLSSVWVQGDIFERDLRHVSVGQRADVSTPAYPADHFSAQVSRIASIVDAQTRTAKVLFLVANPGARLKPGMFASISLYLPEGGPVLTVGAKAVFVEEGHSFAYVQTGAEEFARRPVEAAAIGSDRLRILKGLDPGDRVVSDGVLLLRQLEADAAGR